MPAEDPDWKNKSHVACAWPDATVYVGYSKALQQRVPKVAQFLKQVAFETPMIAEWILKVDKEKVEPTQVAREWVDKNPEVVKRWLAGIQ